MSAYLDEKQPTIKNPWASDQSQQNQKHEIVNPSANSDLAKITPTKDLTQADLPPIKKEPISVQLVSPPPNYSPLEISGFIVGVFFCCCVLGVLSFIAIKKINKKV